MPTDLLATETLLNYRVQMKKTSQDASAMKDIATLPTGTLSYTITGLEPGTKYDITVNYDLVGKNGWEATRVVGYQWGVKTLPAAVTGLKLTQWLFYNRKMTVEWGRQNSADGYEFECRKSNRALFKTGSTNSYSTNFVTIPNIKNEMVYIVRVRSFANINGTKNYGSWSEPLYCFTQAGITKAKVSGKKLTVK